MGESTVPVGHAGGEAPRQPEGSRQRLIAAAIGVIAERGWLGVTTRRVAAAARVNPALVHYHFGSVEALRRAAAEQVTQDALSSPLGQALADEDVARGFAGALRAVSELRRDDPQMRVLLEASLYATHDAELGEAMASVLAGFRSMLAERIERSVAQGRMRAADPQATAILLVALLDGVGLHWLLSPDLDLAAAAQTLASLLTNGAETEDTP